jgi:hypothetical protein
MSFMRSLLQPSLAALLLLALAAQISPFTQPDPAFISEGAQAFPVSIGSLDCVPFSGLPWLPAQTAEVYTALVSLPSIVSPKLAATPGHPLRAFRPPRVPSVLS